MTRTLRTLTFMGALIAGHAATSEATMFVLGTDAAGNQLIYDQTLDITWYDYSNPVDTWQNQMDWAASLDVDFGGMLYDDWRLPVTAVPDSTCDFPGSMGFACRGSERSPTSSRKNVPPSANSILPLVCFVAPVNAPFS